MLYKIIGEPDSYYEAPSKEANISAAPSFLRPCDNAAVLCKFKPAKFGFFQNLSMLKVPHNNVCNEVQSRWGMVVK